MVKPLNTHVKAKWPTTIMAAMSKLYTILQSTEQPKVHIHNSLSHTQKTLKSNSIYI